MRISQRILLSAAIAVLTTLPSFGQDRVSIRIADGQVTLNDRIIPSAELPTSLDPENTTLQFDFAGGTARFRLGGTLYGVENGRIVELPAGEDDGLTLFFRRESAGAGYDRQAAIEGTWTIDSMDESMGTYVQVLGDRADRLESLSQELTKHRDISADEQAVVVDRMLEEAEQATLMVRAFPRVEMQSYMMALQHRDEMLYGRLLDEQRMELETAHLAHRIALSESAPERESLAATLRTQLDAIFEIKQQNRRDEIAQLEAQLRELQEQLAAREANRQAIIEHRMQRLIGQKR